MTPQTSAPEGIFTEVASEAQLAAQREGSFRLAVKANIAVAGFKHSAGSRILEQATAPVDAPVVAALRAQGATVVGITNMHELAFGITSNNAAFGPVRLPGHPDRSAGGSSGGSAAAVAAGLADLALGTDTGGSVSLPAGVCGVVGFRPSTGRWPTAATVGLSWTRDTPGVFARSVAEVRRADTWVTNAPRPAGPAHPVRLGLPKQFLESLDPHTEKAFNDALVAVGTITELVPIDLAEVIELTSRAEMPVVLWESRHLLADAAAAALGTDRASALRALVEGTLSPDVRGILESELAHPTAPEAYSAAIADTFAARERHLAVLDELGLDGLVFPSSPAPAPLIGEDDTVAHLGERVGTFGLYTKHTGPGTILGVPTLTLPAPVADGALPVGVSIQTRRFDDRRLLDLGLRVEAAFAS